MSFILLFVLFNKPLYAEAETSSNSTANESSQSIFWPLEFFLNAAIYPISAPLRYAFDNGVIESSMELITFGERNNVIIYPTLNLKPGNTTQLGFTYRHRSLFFKKDYLVMQSSYYANGDWYASVRYSKQELFGLPLFGAFRYTQYWDRDNVFVVPNTKEEFVQPDSTMKFQWRIGSPLNDSKTLNISTNIGLNFVDESVPDNAKDSLLLHQKFAIKDRGIYQKSTQVPIELAFIFDNLDFSYAPSKGSRFLFSAEYTFVNQYHGLKYSDVGINKVGNYKDGGLNHDFIRNQIIFQHYFYLGKSNHYILSKTEARQSRRFYTDFSWDEALRVWHPDKIKETLFERRVLAIQFRMENMWETEEGGAPFNAYPYLNGRYPLRGYGNQWAAAHIMGLSAEYRWPVDRFVDGVVFNEYALHAPEIDDWSFDRYYNSWGIGVRVRQPNMYLFRLQFGFHGLHGINIIMTIAPEFK